MKRDKKRRKKKASLKSRERGSTGASNGSEWTTREETKHDENVAGGGGWGYEQI